MDREQVAVAITNLFAHVIVQFSTIALEYIVLPLVSVAFIILIIPKIWEWIR